MIRFGIIGAGRIAHKFAEDILKTENAKLVAVASRNLEKAVDFKQEHNLSLAFGSYEELVQSTEIDAVYVATPHNFHKDHAILAMSHKKHVLCEKPMGVNELDVIQMIETAKAHKVVLMEAMWTSFLPAYRRLHSILQSNEFGRLLKVDIRFGFALTNHETEKGRILNPDLAGGSLLDIGVYPISVLRFITNAPYKTLETDVLFSSTGVDLYLTMDLVLDNETDTIVHLESAVDRELSNRATLVFEQGIIEIPGFHGAQEIIINNVRELYPHKSEGFEYEIESFAQTVLNKVQENQIVPLSFTIDTVRMMDDIREQIGLKYPFE